MIFNYFIKNLIKNDILYILNQRIINIINQILGRIIIIIIRIIRIIRIIIIR